MRAHRLDGSILTHPPEIERGAENHSGWAR